MSLKKTKNPYKKRPTNQRAQQQACQALLAWYQKHKRPLPWRDVTDPYHIWLSEVMLQQTTVKTVIPYYKKFLKKFNNITALAQADLKEIFPHWSGLGYYSRVKNLHKSAQRIKENKYFPKTYKELLKLPGFGPYTARAVSSLAFGEKTAVLDANVIRVMARYKGFKGAWWGKTGRDFLQKEADKWVQKHPPTLVNQALMELGALVCGTKRPLCLLCPLSEHCQAYQHNQTNIIPRQKKKQEKDIWLWKPQICIKKNSVALTKAHSLPVLKNYPSFPGKASLRKTAPRQYHFVHSVTHHVIYVQFSLVPRLLEQQLLWVKPKDIRKHNPSSLIQKILRDSLFAKLPFSGV